MRFRHAVVPLLFLLSGQAFSKTVPEVCGYHREGWREEAFLHGRSMASRKAVGLERRAAGPPGRDAGNIAVMYSGDGVVASRNVFGLNGRKITFTPSAPGAPAYRFSTGDSGYDETAALSGEEIRGMGDDDSRRFPLPFPFPFFGKTYGEFWVNSDGNLSFEEGDSAAMAKSVGLMSSGPPRVAPLLMDLDPSYSTRGVRVLRESGKVAVTWLEVPEYRAGGGGITQTFQIILYPNGAIEFHYQRARPTDAVTGITPGRNKPNTAIVSFAEGSAEEFGSTVAERFSASQAIDPLLLAQRFYETHDDSYDYLAVYNTLGISARDGAVATEVTVRSRFREGFGDIPVDLGAQYGSPRRLQAFLNMGQVDQYPADPTAPVPARAQAGDTPLSILAHEVGHLFLALASVRDEMNPAARPMLGAGQSHWNFNFNSDASFLEGNQIEDAGENVTPRFRTVATAQRYSALDQYLMGLRAPWETPPSFLVQNSGMPGQQPPRAGVSLSGTRRNVTVEELIEAEGRRSPDYTVAQRRFRLAVILVVPSGTEPSEAVLAQLERLRSEFEGFYSRGTDNRASIDTTLRRGLQLSSWPAAGVRAGREVQGTVSIGQAADAPVTVTLRTQSGIVQTPAAVVIPAGQTQAAFSLRGVQPGVELLTAESAGYAPDEARIQVAADASGLTLVVEEGGPDDGFVGIRVSDVNLIPYQGIAVRASAAGGTVAPAEAITGPDGIARFQWRQGVGANQFRATVDGATTALVISASGRPSFTAAGVANAASYALGLTPGGLGTLFGVNLANGTGLASAQPWPTVLAGVQLLADGLPVRIFYASPTQINFLVPESLSGETVTLEVVNEAGFSDPVRVPVLPLSPGLFFNGLTGEAAVLVAGTGQLTSARPIRAGEYFEIYATGLGPVFPGSNGLLETALSPTVRVGDAIAEVVFSGQAPGVPGLYQINARVPGNLPPGVWKMAIELEGLRSNEADVTVGR